LIEMVLDRYFPRIHAAFGVFLPLLTVQCAILAGSLFMVERRYDLAESVVFGLGSGSGFALAVIMLAAIRSRLVYADLPDGLRGLGITFVIAGMMSLGFSAFAQMVAP
jgi:Na+-transporting NADH:ubiquinone oxidoreductase subunit E